MASVEAGKIRAFLALPLAEAFQQEVSPAIGRWKKDFPGVRWVNPREIHVTLHFFGSIKKEAVTRAVGRVRPLAQKCVPFEIFLDGTGAFPSSGRLRVFWIGVEGNTAPLLGLQAEIVRNLSVAGYAVEERVFKPHLTVGRIPEGAKARFPLSLDFPKTPPRRMDRIVLFQSCLTPNGAHYETLETFPFQAS